MIKSFRDKETARLFQREMIWKIPSHIQRTALRKLWMIDAADTLEDIKVPPANHLEKLKGVRMDQYSIRVNDQWRICFRWSQGNAHEVELTDYH